MTVTEDDPAFDWDRGSSELSRPEASLILGIPAIILLSAVPAMLLASLPTHPSDFEALAFGAFANLAFYSVILFILGLRGIRSEKRSRFGPATIFAAIYWIFVAFTFLFTLVSNGLVGAPDVTIALLFALDVSLGLLWAFLVLRRSIVDGAWSRSEWTR